MYIVYLLTGGAPPPAGSVPKYSGEMPDDDVMDDPNRAETQPTAPPMEKMDHIGGYNNVGFNASESPDILHQYFIHSISMLL